MQIESPNRGKIEFVVPGLRDPRITVLVANSLWIILGYEILYFNRSLLQIGVALGSCAVLDFIAQKISPQTYLNLMDHYYPWYRADGFPPIGRSLRHGEFPRVLEMAEQRGLHRLDEHHERRRLGI